MTKDEILQKVNDYCNEKSYTEETLTSDFKNQFAENYIIGRENADIKDEKIISDIEFNIRTAFSASSKGITAKNNLFLEKENDYQKQIEELKKKAKDDKHKGEGELPEKYKKQLEELANYKKSEELKKKRQEISELAKKDIRPKYHSAFDKFFEKVDISSEGEEKELAKKTQEDFYEMMKGMIGNIYPFYPTDENIEEKDKAMLQDVKAVKI